ncbi:MAG: signal peptidase II, partial [Dysgonamonadaceae bacterium]|nr:signal peptidase II [Dysgonamonadaceae bacterium]
MKMKLSKGTWAVLVILLVLLVDQFVKIWVKTHLGLYGRNSIQITSWFYIYFTENNGMAFGWELFNKTLLTLFRLGASVWIG